MPNTLGKNLNLCFTKIKLPLFSQSTPMTPTPQATPVDHSRPLSPANCTSILIRNFNSLYEDALDSTSKSLTNSPPSLAATSDYDGGAVAVAAAFASRRFFFSTPGRSNSIVDSADAAAAAEPDEAAATLFGNSVAVPTFSPDPYADFRRSMQEMVEARELMDVQKSNWEFLHELLL